MPVALGRAFRHPFSTRSAAIIAGHLRAGAALIQEHQLPRVDLPYAFPPRLPALLRFRRFRLLADLLPQPRLHRRRHSALRAAPPPRSLDLPSARAGGGDLLGPAFAHSELFCQLPQGPFALLISLQKLSPQIIRVGSCHSGGGGESPRI